VQPAEDFAADAVLREELRAGSGLVVLTGGQTGVDTYAARAALEAGLRVHLVFPRGLRQEDDSLTAARRQRLAAAIVHELTDERFRYRTWTCAYLADVVLLLDPAGGSGCQETLRAARYLGRPLMRPEPDRLTAAQTESWLAETSARVLMVAGCRASVLASRGKGRGLRTQLATIMAGAASQDERLRAGQPG
jgi:predicted Rossmann fold nucleotide-binding protein DprA/Smf involved in DNA uptake